jgi:hypothetical protein
MHPNGHTQRFYRFALRNDYLFKLIKKIFRDCQSSAVKFHGAIVLKQQGDQLCRGTYYEPELICPGDVYSPSLGI